MKIDFEAVRAGVRSEAYYATASEPRFQAVERHHLRLAARVGMLVIILIAVLGGVIDALVHGRSASLIIGLDVTLGVVAAGAWQLLGSRLRHYPEPVVFFVASAVVIACVVLGIGAPELSVLASGYLLIIPPVVSQVITWRTWTHTLWLAFFLVAMLGFLSLAPIADLSPREKLDIAVLAVISFVASFIGHVLGIRSRIRSYSQLRTIQRLHRSMERQRKELSRALAQLERTSRVDPLTRIANRLRLDEDFEEVRAQVNRTGQTYGLLEADLDRFKAVNDELGHLAGDAVLRTVAQALQGALRAGDHVYRYGGEEFIVLIANADAAATRATAERLRATIEGLGLGHPDGHLGGRVTVSVGGTVIGPADIDATDGALFDRADRAMYLAKTNGRNRVKMELPGWYTALPEAVEAVATDGTA